MDAWPAAGVKLFHYWVQCHWTATYGKLVPSCHPRETAELTNRLRFSCTGTSLKAALQLARFFAIVQREARSSRRRDGRTHLGSISNFSQASSEFHRITSFRTAERALANDANDKWAPVRRLIDAFNKRCTAIFFPSWSICVKRVLVHGGGNYCSDGMPHVTKIARKPKEVGSRAKGCGMCSDSGDHCTRNTGGKGCNGY